MPNETKTEILYQEKLEKALRNSIHEEMMASLTKHAKLNLEMAEARKKYFSDNPPDETENIYFRKMS